MKTTWKKHVLPLLLAIVLLVSGVMTNTLMITPSAKQGDYAKWKENYEATGEDPYEQYYEAWNIPSVQTVYVERGEAAADAYVGLFISALLRSNTESQMKAMQEVAADLDNTWPKLPSAAWTAESDPYVNLYQSLSLPTFGEVEQAYGREYAIQWREVTEQLDKNETVANRDRMLPDAWGKIKTQYEAEEAQREQNEKNKQDNIDRLTQGTGYGTTGGVEDPKDIAKKNGEVDSENNTTQYFPDVASDAWYAEAVNAMAQTGLLGGRPDGLFYPEDTITLGEWATIVWRIAGGYVDPNGYLNPKWAAGSSGETKYPHWASYALYMTGNGDAGLAYINATCSEDGHIENSPCSRFQAVMTIMELVDGERSEFTFLQHHNPNDDGVPDMLEARQKNNGAKTWTLEEIPDHELLSDRTAATVAGTIEDNVVRAYNLGIINGMDEQGTFDPDRTLTRAQACQMLYNALLTRPRPVNGRARGGVTF